MIGRPLTGWKKKFEKILKKFAFCKNISIFAIPKRDDSLAQQVEHNTFNVGVLGSSPRRITGEPSEMKAFFVCIILIDKIL